IVDSGFVITTHPIQIEHNNTRYDIGTSGIRISSEAQYSVWAETTKHPNRIPHPHIPLTGSPCYGSISIALDEAAAEYRWDDLVSYLLQWLSMGYSEDVADSHIEEWPVVEGVKV